MSVLVKARGLGKSYGSLRALDNVDFDIEEGCIVGLIGPNGAGKTTALKAILGLTEFEGELDVFGHDPRISRHRLLNDVSFIADVAVLPRWLKVSNAVEFVEAVHPRFNRERAMHFLERTKIRQRSKVGELSKGMVTQLHLALIMAIDAKLLVLDEPTLGLDILYRKEFYTTLLNDYFDGKRTIIVTTHQVEEIEKILTHLMFINNGRVTLNLSMEEVAEQYAEVLVNPDKAAVAQTLKPLYERDVFGKKLYLFEGVERDKLAELGELHTPSVADIFVAKMKGAAQ
ncbi:MAG TPA: ABC transporter ATP-binding protein [Gammaproteobacteria bacterium]|nr:ABC transporter ATP-binding protein [Gammaproteobacteria bacterium]